MPKTPQDFIDPEVAQKIAIQAVKWHKARREYWDAENFKELVGGTDNVRIADRAWRHLTKEDVLLQRVVNPIIELMVFKSE